MWWNLPQWVNQQRIFNQTDIILLWQCLQSIWEANSVSASRVAGKLCVSSLVLFLWYHDQEFDFLPVNLCFIDVCFMFRRSRKHGLVMFIYPEMLWKVYCKASSTELGFLTESWVDKPWNSSKRFWVSSQNGYLSSLLTQALCFRFHMYVPIHHISSYLATKFTFTLLSDVFSAVPLV